MSFAGPRQLVLLPGLLCDGRLWRPQLAALSGSAGIHIADLTTADSVTGIAREVLSHAPPGRFALAGLSMGGYVALEIMRLEPARVRALALLDTSARPDTPEATEARRAAMLRARTDLRGVITNLMPKLLHPAHVGDPALSEVIRAMAEEVGVTGFLRQQEAIIARPDSRPSLANIDCPTLVLCGREDALTPVEVHEELTAGIPGAELRIIGTCGHLSTLEQPAAVSAALQDWLVLAWR